MDSPLAARIGRVARHVCLLGIALAVTSACSAGAVFAALDTPPAPDGPGGVVALLKWCWTHRDAQRYRDLFTADFQFIPSAPDLPWNRDDELAAAAALFGPGTATQSGAAIIGLEFLGAPLLPGTLDLPGKPYPAYQQLIAPALLDIDRNDGSNLHALNLTMFYMVRGDLAAIPPEMQARGIGPDPHRWYIERWEDAPTRVDVDHPPVIEAPPKVIARVGQPLTLEVLAHDPDGEAIQFSAHVPPGASFLPTLDSETERWTGTLRWTPTQADSGQHAVTFLATNRQTISDTTMILVLPPMVPPVAALTLSPNIGGEPLLVRVDASASTDPDGVITSFRFNFGDGTFLTQGYPVTTHSFNKGKWTVIVTATDNDGAVDTASAIVNVTGPNHAPVASLICAPVSGRGPLLVSLDARGSRDQDGQIVSYKFDFGDGVSQTQATPTATHTYGLGRPTATLTVTDDLGSIGVASVTLDIFGDRPPKVTAPATSNVMIGSSLAFDVTVSDPDSEAIASLTTRGLPAGATFVPAANFRSGHFSWTPVPADVGTYHVTFKAQNALADSVTTTITVAPHPPDRPPVVTALPVATVNVGSSLALGVSAIDPDGDAIVSLTAQNVPVGAAFEAAADQKSGRLSWTPTLADTGTYNVTFTAQNAMAGSATTTITVGPRPADQPPAVSAPGSVSVKVGAELVLAIGAYDPDGDAISSLTADVPAGAVFTATAANDAATFRWSPAASDVGFHAITFTATNALQGSAVTQVNVKPPNQSPIAALTATPASGSEPLFVSLDASGSSDPDGMIASYTFEFGDGTSVTQRGKKATHTYLAGQPTSALTARVTVMDDDDSTSTATATVTVTPPVAVSEPTQAVAVLASSWNERDVSRFGDLLTGDFRFSFGPGDVAGDPYPNRSWGRADELTSARHLFEDGKGIEPPATAVHVVFNQNPLVGTSFVAGRNYPWHRQVLVPKLTLDIERGLLAGPLHAEGPTLFSVVRGDSAELSQELIDRGVVPDSTVWYVEGWSDMTGQGPVGNLAPIPSLQVTPATGFEGVTALVDASHSVDPDGTIVSFTFDFGDGSAAVVQPGPSITHTFQVGQWSVRVTTTDDRGTHTTASTMVTVLSASAAANLCRNPSFEAELKGWNSYAGSLVERVAGGSDGGYAARVTGPAVVVGSFGVNDSPDMVRYTIGPGIRYRYTAWVRSPSSQGLAKLRVTEYLIATGAKLGLVTSEPVRLSPNWQMLTVDYVTTSANSTLDFQVRDFPVAPSEVFFADNIAIRNITGPNAGTGMAKEADALDLAPMPARLVPSPLRVSGILSFSTSEPGALRVEILDVAGRRVRRLYDDHDAPAGLYELPIGRTGEDGMRLGAGVYFWRIQAKEGVRTGRFVMLQ